MKVFKYKRYSWVNGEKTSVDLEMTAQDLYRATGGVGLIDFLLLINTWNCMFSCNGENLTGAIHKYVYQPDY